jgi:hypothetical protein
LIEAFWQNNICHPGHTADVEQEMKNQSLKSYWSNTSIFRRAYIFKERKTDPFAGKTTSDQTWPAID